jgi:hypothetical protein
MVYWELGRIRESPMLSLFRNRDFDRVSPLALFFWISIFVFLVFIGFQTFRFLALGFGLIFLMFVIGIGLWFRRGQV